MRTYRILLCVVVLLPLLAMAALAQDKPQSEPAKGPLVKVQLVLSRYEGDRRTSSLPFTMLATANGGMGSIRTGSQVPIVTATAANDKTSFQYVDIGSSVDCTVKTAENGRFNVILMLQDRSTVDKVAVAGSVTNPITVPVLRNFNYTNSIVLKDGESKQIVAASDKGSGEIIKIDITLNVEK